MKHLFLFMLRLSLNVSFAVVPVLAARLLLRRAPKKLSCMLWYAVLFCMLCPLRLPFAAVLERLSGAVSGQAAETALGIAAANEAVQTASAAVERLAAIQQSKTGPDFMALFAAIWISAAVLLLGKTVWETILLANRVKNAQQLEADVLIQQDLQTAFVIGMLRPRIYLPQGLDPGQQTMVLQHERCHIKRGDHIVKLLFYAAACVHWFNPFVWLAWSLLQQDMEMACDEQVLQDADAQQKQMYCRTILSFAAAKRTAARAAFAEKPTKRRVENILRFHKPGKAVFIACTLLAAATLLLTLCMPVMASGGPFAADGDTAVLQPQVPDAQTESSAGISETPSGPSEVPALVWHMPLAGNAITTRGFSAAKHEALDILARLGDSVFAAADGTVLEATFDAMRGNYVVLQHTGGYESHYHHLESISVCVGDTVAAMAPIGTAGVTGSATGVHLHFAVFLNGEAIDPAPLLGIDA